MDTNNPRAGLPFGLFELDPSGMIVYYRADGPPLADSSTPDLVGRNLFTEIMDESQSKDLEAAVRRFWWTHEPTRDLDLTFWLSDAPVAARVLLARVREQAGEAKQESIFLRIKRA